MPSAASVLVMIRRIQRFVRGASQCPLLASRTTSSCSFKLVTLYGPLPIGGACTLSAVSALPFSPSRIGPQTCFGVRFTLASVVVSNAALGVFSVKRTVLPPVAATLAILATNGLYIGDLSPAGASKENTTSSTVTGLPSCHF